MNRLKTTILTAAMLVLLGIDALIGLSGTLHMPPAAGFGLVAFIVAVPLFIATGQKTVLSPQDSRLLVALGVPGEDEQRDGATMLVWNGTALRKLRFVPRADLCPG